MVCIVEVNCVFCEVQTDFLYTFVYFSLQIVRNRIATNFCTYEFNLDPLKLRGHYMYHQFNTHKFYVLPTQLYLCVCVDLRTNSDYFPTQH